MSGADWMLGDVGKPKPKRKLVDEAEGIVVTKEDVDEVLADTAGSGKRLREGIKAAESQLEQLKRCGLTGEALVLLVHAKCRTPTRGGKPPSLEAVQLVLEGLFRLGEHVR